MNRNRRQLERRFGCPLAGLLELCSKGTGPRWRPSMVQRVIPDLIVLKDSMLLNDEAHHGYRAKQGPTDDQGLAKEDK
jgi:hypothetical protein